MSVSDTSNVTTFEWTGKTALKEDTSGNEVFS